jgi:predicted DNA-binding mobile mystery protein A
MKLNKAALHKQRQALDLRLQKWHSTTSDPIPRRGWLRAIRESLGITARQLASRTGTDMASVLRLEEREVKQTASLQALEKAARAMGCKLVYAIVPESSAGNSLEKLLEEKALATAREISKSVGHSMRLEKQGVAPKETESQIQNLANELKQNLDSKIWNKK